VAFFDQKMLAFVLVNGFDRSPVVRNNQAIASG
jgi:hypothetical protein